MSKRKYSQSRPLETEEESLPDKLKEGPLSLSESSDVESQYSDLDSEPDTTEDEDSAHKLDSSDDLQIVDQMSSWREAEETDTSDEEELRNTVGNIPLDWYEDYPHRGYDIEGRTIAKPATADELDEFLSKMENTNYWCTVKDPVTGRDVVLTDEQLDLIQRIERSQFPTQGTDPYEPYVDHFTHEKQLFPLSDTVKPKSSFVPSKWERQKVVKLVHAIKMGWIKPRKAPHKPKFYNLWGEGSETTAHSHRMHIPAPRLKLPGHSESYNPPPEYLPNEKEREEWNQQDLEDRAQNFLPQRFASLREVPAYPNFIQERFERCLDLYLCPRQRRMRVQVDPDDLLPKLPKPKDLQPFPTSLALEYKGHVGMVRCVSVEPVAGQWIASGGEDSSVRLWEVLTGRCVEVITLQAPPTSVKFCPTIVHTLLAVTCGSDLIIINHGLGDRLLLTATDTLLANLDLSSADLATATWTRDTIFTKRESLCVQHTKPVKQVTWHKKGDYLATVSDDATGSDILVHQLSKARSQTPFHRLKGRIQHVAFHPSKPIFFVASQTYVRVYNLAKQELVKKLLSGVKWISSLSVHPSGDHLLLGSYDKRLIWFDLDLSTKPYRVLRHHQQAIRAVSYHSRLPLFVSCSDDGSIIVCHGQVFNDLMQNPQIVPVKLLKGGTVVNNLGVLHCTFHPVQPWVISAGADSVIRLYA